MSRRTARKTTGHRPHIQTAEANGNGMSLKPVPHSADAMPLSWQCHPGTGRFLHGSTTVNHLSLIHRVRHKNNLLRKIKFLRTSESE